MVGDTAKSGGASGNHRILAILLVMILLHTSHCGASVAAADASIFQDNVTSLNYQGHIIDIEEPHLWFDSEIRRMLGPNSPVTPATKNPYKAAISDCNRPPKYLSCLPKEAVGKPKEKCDPYKRSGC